MAEDNRSVVEAAAYREGLQRFDYFIVGVSLVLCAYNGFTLHPEKLTSLSPYTIELLSFALLIVSAGAGLKRIEALVQISGLNAQLLDAIEKRGAVMVTKPNSEGVIVIRYPGRLLTSEEAANWVGVLNDKIQVLNHMIETATSKAERIYKWRNRLLLVGFCGLLASKIFAPYLNS
jgi:hypothetical protein